MHFLIHVTIIILATAAFLLMAIIASRYRNELLRTKRLLEQERAHKPSKRASGREKKQRNDILCSNAISLVILANQLHNQGHLKLSDLIMRLPVNMWHQGDGWSDSVLLMMSPSLARQTVNTYKLGAFSNEPWELKICAIAGPNKNVDQVQPN
jgi:hypothetical protein